MKVTKMKKILRILSWSALVLFAFNGRVLADSVTASSSLNWAAASFSGPVAPWNGGTPGGPSTIAGAFYQTISGLPIVGCAADAVGWTSVACSVQFGTDHVAASADSEFEAIAAASVGYLSTAETERLGTIVVGTNGDVNIEIPFSATIVPTVAGNCGPSCNYFGQVEGAIFLSGPNLPPPGLAATLFKIGDFKESDGTMSIGGILDLADTGLTPGTYFFNVQAVSQVQVTPEPSTILLLGTGLFAVAGMALRKRFA